MHGLSHITGGVVARHVKALSAVPMEPGRQ